MEIWYEGNIVREIMCVFSEYWLNMHYVAGTITDTGL